MIKKCVISALIASLFFFLFSPEIWAGEPVEIVAGEILLKFKKETAKDVKEAFQKKYELALLRESKVTGVCLYQSKVDDVLSLIEQIKNNAAVEFVEPNYVIKKNSTPNDPFYSSQWYLPKISMPVAWDQFTGTTIVKVAVIDSGVNKSHPDLAGVLLSLGEWDYVDWDSNADDENGHGTLVAGIIGAIHNNNVGISGSSINTRIVPIRVSDSDGYSNSADIADAIESAVVNGCKIINCSFGGPFSSAESAAITYADVMGVLVVCSSGNGDNNGVNDGIGDNNDLLPTNYPSSYTQKNILSVANTTSSDILELSSNYGLTSVDIAAPGTEIFSCLGVFNAPDEFRETICEWTFNESFEGWAQRTITGQGFVWDSVRGGLFSISNYLGVYWPNTMAYLQSPDIDCTNYVASKLTTLGTGGLEFGDYLEIYSGTSTFQRATMYSTLPADINGINTVSISAIDQSVGRAWYWFTTDSYYNSYFGILYTEVTGIPIYQSNSGTSFAAPVVTGVAAMLMSQNPNLTHLQVKDIILQTARRVSALNGKVVCGGIVDAAAALREAKARIIVTLTITSDLSAVSVNLGSTYSYQITASGSPTSFGAIRLPTGLKLNAKTGLISGKPTKVGTFSATLQALKKGSTTATATKVFTVVQVPTFTYAATINAKIGKALKVVPKMAGYPAPTFSIVSGSLPPGLLLNATTAAITGTPTTTGTYPFTVRGSNSAGNTDRSATIVVK